MYTIQRGEMSVNFKNRLQQLFYYHQLLHKISWVTMNNTLSWNNHIGSIMKKLSKASYIIRNAKAYMSVSLIKEIYFALFHSVMSYGIIFWGNSSHIYIIFRIQKR